MQKENCPLCKKNDLCKNKKFPLLIQEFAHSYLILGDHQFYRGYSQIIFKDHARELHTLETNVRKELFEEVMQAGKAVTQAFSPLKMNYASYGNLVEHIHWHIIPRYEEDPRHKEDPFSNASEFHKFVIKEEEVELAIELIRSRL